MIKMLNEKMKKMTVVDIGLVKLSAFCFAIIIVKLFPVLLNISYPVLIILVLAFGAGPLYKTWFQNQCR
ncbi:MAG: hypothetical protein HQL21_04820 [Candidatus Omnitrophica bacterium]|nr:hypothetical protein [Candidatus Omnitrophota bacterium]